MDVKYLNKHFKHTWTKNGWILVEVTKAKDKPVSKNMWTRIMNYGKKFGWEYHETNGAKFVTMPFTEAEKQALKETGEPSVAYIKRV
jgi:hypothetical protein